MAQLDETLPPWLKRAVKAQAISLDKAYLMLWLCEQDQEWITLPQEMTPEAEAIYLLELRQVGPTQ